MKCTKGLSAVVFMVGIDKFRSKPTCQAKQVFGIFSSCLLSSLKNEILFKGMLFEGLLVKYTYSSITIMLGYKIESCFIYVRNSFVSIYFLTSNSFFL